MAKWIKPSTVVVCAIIEAYSTELSGSCFVITITMSYNSFPFIMDDYLHSLKRWKKCFFLRFNTFVILSPLLYPRWEMIKDLLVTGKLVDISQEHVGENK